MIFLFPIIMGVWVGGWFALCFWIGSRQVGWTRYFFLWFFNRWGPEEKKISIIAALFLKEKNFKAITIFTDNILRRDGF